MEREQALDAALSQIERQYGKGAVMKMGDQAQFAIPSISTGSLSLDLALGVGGLPARPHHRDLRPGVLGQDDARLPRHRRGAAPRRDLRLHRRRARDGPGLRAGRIGVNIDDLLVSQPDHGEQALEIAELLIRSGALDVVAVDSVAALTPKAEIEGEMGDSHVGLQARLMSQALRKLAGTLNRTGTDRHLHEPAAREDRRHVRQPGDDHRAAARSSSTPPSGSTSAASRRSRRASRRSATASASRW